MAKQKQTPEAPMPEAEVTIAAPADFAEPMTLEQMAGSPAYRALHEIRGSAGYIKPGEDIPADLFTDETAEALIKQGVIEKA